MSTSPQELSRWQAEVRKSMPNLSKPVATMLALWSFGIVFAKTTGRMSVALFLAMLLGKKAANIEQRLYEWCIGREHKSGDHRLDWDVRGCFSPLLAWIVRLWQSEKIALVLDATSLSDQFIVLTISVVYRQMGLPVAWKIMRANTKHPWRKEWLALIRCIWRVIPKHWQVLVLADRGLYADWLFRRVVRVGWHPFFRVNGQGKFAPDATRQTVHTGRYLHQLLCKRGDTYVGTGVAFSGKHRLACTVLGYWSQIHKDPWFVLTDLLPQDCDISWYGLRSWCEQGFKCVKRGGWQWQHTRMEDPDRAERLWLAIAIAMLWCVAVGSVLEKDPEQAHLFQGWTACLTDAPHSSRTPRTIRVMRVGMFALLVAVILSRPLSHPACLHPDPWPIFTSTPKNLPP